MARGLLVDLLSLLLLILLGLGFILRITRRIREARTRIRASRERIYTDGMFCIHCGYNMRSNPQQCSECGYRPGAAPVNPKRP